MSTQISVLSAIVLFSISTTSFALVTPQTDPCRAKAITAAQEEYGNDPYRTTIRTVSDGQSYKVTVGIGNPEDGAHLYDVTFANGCSGEAVAVEAPEVAINPLQAATHDAYAQLVSYNSDIPASNEVDVAQVPAKVQKYFAATEKNLQLLVADWAKQDGKTSDLHTALYQVEVAGQTTYAVMSPNLHDSIRAYLAVFDSKGNEIDSASVYGSADTGQNGVTWQNESVQK